MRILVAEDEIGIAKFLKQGLEEESYAVDICDEGKKAFQLALSGEYDLLLLDWMIPGMSGIEICRQFRKQDKETPIIILTAKDTVEETIFGLQAGANDYIKKPFHFDELLERIRVQLRSKASVENVLILGDIEMDLNTHQINRSGSEVQLTQKEFA
ncbi:MAG: response regulator transcription factor, partial [Cyclobacteriaceae bacterium]|nr:response regulator transcription factor [Cyclobacteriaceae bacterium]